MQIGFVEQRQMTIGKDEQGQPKIAQWFEMIIKAPGIREFSLKLSPVQPEQGKRMPAYNMFYRANQRKGEQYRDLKAGALWHETSKDGQTQYLSGNIESPAIPGGMLRIALFQSKPIFQGEQVIWIYDVIWSPEKPKQDQADDDYAPQYGNTVPPQKMQQNQQQHNQAAPAQSTGFTNPDGSPMSPAEVQSMQAMQQRGY